MRDAPSSSLIAPKGHRRHRPGYGWSLTRAANRDSSAELDPKLALPLALAREIADSTGYVTDTAWQAQRRFPRGRGAARPWLAGGWRVSRDPERVRKLDPSVDLLLGGLVRDQGVGVIAATDGECLANDRALMRQQNADSVPVLNPLVPQVEWP